MSSNDWAVFLIPWLQHQLIKSGNNDTSKSTSSKVLETVLSQLKPFVWRRSRCRRGLLKFPFLSLLHQTLQQLCVFLFIAVYNSVMSGCMTSHWLHAMKMLRQALVNCPPKTWKNCAANREELKRKLKKTRKVKIKIESSRNVMVNSLCQYLLNCMGFLTCSNQWCKRNKRQWEESGSVKRTAFGIRRISQGMLWLQSPILACVASVSLHAVSFAWCRSCKLGHEQNVPNCYPIKTLLV